MEYSTQIDTISIRIDCNTAKEQTMLFNSLNSFMITYCNVTLKQRDNAIGSIEQNVYYGHFRLATINIGMYNIPYSMGEHRYYISIRFAGLKRYKSTDSISPLFLEKVCAYLNTNWIPFKVTALDVCLDMECQFDNILAVCTKHTPQTKYYSLTEEQYYKKTTYIEKIPKRSVRRASCRAYTYDKSNKDNLKTKITRFEIKFQNTFFTRYGLSLMKLWLSMERYTVMYFSDIQDKLNVMREYDNSSIRYKQKLINEVFKSKRLNFNIGYIRSFIQSINDVFIDDENTRWYFSRNEPNRNVKLIHIEATNQFMV